MNISLPGGPPHDAVRRAAELVSGQEHPGGRHDERCGAGTCAGCGALQQCMETLLSHYQQNILLRQGNIMPIS